MRQTPLPRMPNVSSDAFEGAALRCPHGLREHMHFWCAPFLTWEPESRLWGKCDAEAQKATSAAERARLKGRRLRGAR